MPLQICLLNKNIVVTIMFGAGAWWWWCMVQVCNLEQEIPLRLDKNLCKNQNWCNQINSQNENTLYWGQRRELKIK